MDDDKRSEALAAVCRGLTSTTDPEVYACLTKIAVTLASLQSLLVAKGIITLAELETLEARITSDRDQEEARGRDEAIEALGPLAVLLGLKR